MNDKLEKFISEHREEFEIFEPGDDSWKGIRSRLRRQKRHRITARGILWRAAAVVVIFMLSFAVQEFLLRKDLRVARRGDRIRTDAIPELKEAEVYYSNLVDEKLSEIRPLIGQYPELGEEIEDEMSVLDSVYDGLRSDLADNIANDEVVEAMIQNYRLKLEILEDLQHYFRETPKTEKNEKKGTDL